jgi:small-conductance mechanosensitive channel
MQLNEPLLSLLPTTVGVVLVVVALVSVHLWLQRRPDAAVKSFRNQIVMIGLTAVAGIAVIMILPLDSDARGQLLGFLGIMISAAIALSSTTFLGNALAGLLLRSVKNFRIGDFIDVNEHMGRVTERGLFHTEIQTENRTLTTLPNLYIVTQPVTTLRSSGTIVSACVTLGYEIPRRRIESLLLEAARTTGLTDPYVQILDLRDFSVEYRVAGLLEDVKLLIRTRSELRANMLDSLHGGGVEIVSPSFMNQRVLAQDSAFIPPANHPEAVLEQPATVPEKIIFDKADEAEADAAQTIEHAKIIEEIEVLRKKIKETPKDGRARLDAEMQRLDARKIELEGAILQTKSKVDETD